METNARHSPASHGLQRQVHALANPWLAASALLLLTLLVYIPTYKAGFIWDDEVIAGHPLMAEGWRGLRDIWFSIRFGDFCPVTATSFWIEWQIHGGMREIQHATNVVLQACNALLLWRILLVLRIPGAWLVAAVFAIHPLCVSSVTWLAERKNTLSMFFYLLSLLFYFRSEPTDSERKGRSERRQYRLSFIFFILGLLSKTSVVVLPVVMLLCQWWREGRIARAGIRRVAPFFAFSFVAGFITLLVHFHFGPKLGVLPTDDNALERVLTATRAFWFYTGKALLPLELTMHYPRWNVDAGAIAAYTPGVAILGLLFIFWRYRSSWGKAGLFGVGYFLIAVGPTIGVVNMAFLMVAPVADHLQYLALPGVIALLVGGSTYHLQKAVNSPAVVAAFAGVVLCALAIVSWQHQRVMADAETLWTDNLRKNPISWISHNNLGGIYFERGEFERARQSYEAAVRERDKLSMVQVNLGRSLFALGRTDEAITCYTEAIRLDSTDFKAHNNLGVAYIATGRTNEAISSFRKAVELAPTDVTFLANLTALLLQSGEAKAATRLLQETLKRHGGNAAVHYQVGGLLFNEGKIDEAAFHYSEAVRLSPTLVEARFGLAEVLARQNRKGEAIAQWRKILQVNPDAPQVLANLAWALATDPDAKIRNGSEAVVFAEKTCAMTGQNDPAYLDLLAAAYAEAGRFAEAIKTAEKALLLAETGGPAKAADKYRYRLDLYRKEQPFRTP